MNKTVSLIIELAFSVLMGLMLLFVVTTLVSLILPTPPYYGETYAMEVTRDNNLKASFLALVVGAAALFGAVFTPLRYRVLGNGLLAGGAFVLIYSATQGFSLPDTDKALTLLVVVACFLVVLVVGWLKFVKLGGDLLGLEGAPAEAGASPRASSPGTLEAVSEGDATSLDLRVTRLEERLERLKDL